jgi:tellurite resistance protein TerC
MGRSIHGIRRDDIMILWAGFIGFVLLLLALDLGVFHRKAHVVHVREALVWSAVWVSLGLAFSVFIFHGYDRHWCGLGTTVDAVDGLENDGWTATEKYLTGYVVEKSLSVDNIFVIAMIFAFFGVPPLYQHRVLIWGILGALLMRGVMIAIGAKLIAEFHWVLYVFGAFLICTAVKMLIVRPEQGAPDLNLIVRLTRRYFPVTARYHGEHFFVRAGAASAYESEIPGVEAQPDLAVDAVPPGTWMITPLALALIIVESTDVVFAVDSIPAIFAITADPFLVFTSNVFAILGLRSLYFALAGMLDKFRYLKVSLALVLLVVGIKMFVAEWLKVSVGKHFNLYLLGVIFSILSTGVITSWMADQRDNGRLKP